MAAGVPPKGASDGVAKANAAEAMFQPPLSWFSVSVCCPAANVTLAVTAVQVCQPPVAGTFTEPVRFVPEEFDRWNPSVTALGAAISKVTLYVPAVATLTVYRNHCPLLVQPISLPPPGADVVSRSTPSER